MKPYIQRTRKFQKRGQVWTADFIIGLIFFIFISLLSVKFLVDAYSPSDYTQLYKDATYLSGNILSSGYPDAWNSTNVIMPGIADGSRINDSRILDFSQLDYYKTKALFHITEDYIFFIQNSTGIINTGQCIYGYNVSVDASCNPQMGSIKYNNLVRIDRIVIYNSTLARLTIYVWN